MKLLEVNTPKLAKTFLEVPLDIYKNDPNWVRPLDKDIERVFDKEKNKFWRHGKAIRWVLQDASGKAIGRVAAFVNNRTANDKKNGQPTGGMGFFECIEDQAAADMLFTACKEWLEKEGMEAMDGPINFGERDGWWGLLAKGFKPPTYQMNYHHPYYLTLFETFGFKVYYEQYVLYRNIQDPLLERFREKYDLVMSQPGYRFEHIRKKDIRKFADDFMQIYNEAWGRHAGFKEMRKEQALSIMNKMKPIIKEELMWFGYHNDRPVSFFIMIPDMNEVFGRFNGKLGLVEKLRTWWILRFGKISRCYGVLFGVVPDYQGKGIDGAMINASGLKLHPQNKWGHMEMNWIGDFNPKMLNVAKGVGGEIYKTYYTMRYLFDREKEYHRLPLMD